MLGTGRVDLFCCPGMVPLLSMSSSLASLAFPTTFGSTGDEKVVGGLSEIDLANLPLGPAQLVARHGLPL